MSVRFRLMTAEDIPAGMRLKDLAGWNQTPADWERFLRASPDGCFVAEEDGRVVGTTTTIVYGSRFAWIGMVLVDPEVRGRSIGTQLLDRAIQSLDRRGVPAQKLDATPQGLPIYARRGFVAEYSIERWTLEQTPKHAKIHQKAAVTSPLPRILKLDRDIFGADRRGLLQSLHQEAPSFTLVAERGAELAGYGLGRHGSRADHLGPWVASDEEAGQELLDEFLNRSTREEVFVDLLKSNPFAGRLLRSRGFTFSRQLTRMYRGRNAHPGRPGRVCAILGPEFG